MKAFKEIGFSKSIKFLFYSLIEFLLTVTFIPQIRVLILKLLGASIGDNTIILNVSFMNLYRGSFANLTVGNNCYIGKGVLLDLAGKIKIGNNITVAERSILITHMNVGYKDHPLQQFYPSKIDKIIIGKGTFVGVGSIILPGVSIGKNCLIAAGSVVTKSIESNTVIGGVPAIKIKSLKNE